MTARLSAFLAELRSIDPGLAEWARERLEAGATLADLEGRLRAALATIGGKNETGL